MKKIGLVLGAGGARGFCHIGVIEVLRENNIPIDIVAGCSMGALVGGGYAAGVPPFELRAIAAAVTNRTVFDIDIRNLTRLKSRGGLALGNRAMQLFNQFAGEGRRIENLPIKFCAVATDLHSHSLHVFRDGSLSDAVRASMSIPGLFQPVAIEAKLLVDGGVLRRMPIFEAREMGADIVIAVDAIGSPNPLSSTSMLGILDTSYQLLDWRSARYEGTMADLLITPDMGTKSSLRFGDNETAIEAGRRATLAALPEIKRLVGIAE